MKMKLILTAVIAFFAVSAQAAPRLESPRASEQRKLAGAPMFNLKLSKMPTVWPLNVPARSKVDHFQIQASFDHGKSWRTQLNVPDGWNGPLTDLIHVRATNWRIVPVLAAIPEPVAASPAFSPMPPLPR